MLLWQLTTRPITTWICKEMYLQMKKKEQNNSLFPRHRLAPTVLIIYVRSIDLVITGDPQLAALKAKYFHTGGICFTLLLFFFWPHMPYQSVRLCCAWTKSHIECEDIYNCIKQQIRAKEQTTNMRNMCSFTVDSVSRNLTNEVNSHCHLFPLINRQIRSHFFLSTSNRK